MAVNLISTKGKPQLEIIIGQAQIGTYRVYLWDEDGQASNKIGEGTSSDDVADIIDLGDITALDKKIITWDILVTSPQGGKGQLYSVIVIFRQNSIPVENGKFFEQGALDGTKLVHGQAVLTVS